MNCKKCCLLINSYTDLSTVCEGRCAGIFHAACVGLTEAQLDCFNENIIWFCDECAMFYRNMRDGSPADTCTNVEQQLTTMRLQITDIQNTLSLIVPTVKPATNVHSTPILSPSQINRTRQNPDVGASRENATESFNLTTLTASESVEKVKRFALFLSNIDGRVPEDSITQLVDNSLGINNVGEIKTTKLVPRWKDCNTLDYASFKIVLHDKWKELALNRSTWPPGVKFREFISHETWKPDNFKTAFT